MVLGRVQTHEQDVAGGRMASPRAVLCRETTPPCQLHPTSVPPRLISPLPPDTQIKKVPEEILLCMVMAGRCSGAWPFIEPWSV